MGQGMRLWMERRVGENELQRMWVLRVLGVDTGGAPTEEPEMPDLLGVWRDAKEAVDAGMQSLAAALHRTDDPDLHRLADHGLFGIGAGENVKLTAALLDYQRAPPLGRTKPAKAVSASVGQYRALISSRLVTAIDANPFGVQVGIRSTMAGALDRIQQSLLRA